MLRNLINDYIHMEIKRKDNPQELEASHPLLLFTIIILLPCRSHYHLQHQEPGLSWLSRHHCLGLRRLHAETRWGRPEQRCPWPLSALGCVGTKGSCWKGKKSQSRPEAGSTRLSG